MYGRHVVFDGGEIREESVTDEWVLANKANQYWLTADKVVITANGVDKAIITVQRVTPPLTDGSQNDVSGVGTAVIRVDGEAIPVTLDENGEGQLEITALETGQFKVAEANHLSNVIEITGG